MYLRILTIISKFCDRQNLLFELYCP